MDRLAPTADAKIDAALVKISIVVVLGSIMSILDSTIVSVALDTLAKTFKTSVANIQWVTTGYLLSLAIVIPATGWMIEAIGAKRAWIGSIAVFVGGSVMCGLAASPTELILFRVLQGIGGGMILPIGQAVLAREAGPSRMGRVMGIVGVPALLGPILGPVVGGLILSHFSWRWIFFVNVPIGVLAIVLATRVLRGTNTSGRPRFDVVGLLLVSPGLAIIIYGLSEAGSGRGFGSWIVVASFLTGIVLLSLFVRVSLRSAQPLLDLRLFAERNFRTAACCSFCISSSIFAAMFLLPLYYQVVRFQTPLHAALFLVPQAVGAMSMMPLSGTISDRTGPRTVTICGLVIMALGTVVFTQVGVSTNEGVLFGAQFVRGLGIGLGSVPLQAAAYRMLGRHLLPSASTLYNIVQRVGSSVATALAAVVLQSRLHLGTRMILLRQITPHSSSSVMLLVARAFGDSYWANLAFVVVALAFAVLLPGRQVSGELCPDDEAIVRLPIDP